MGATVAVLVIVAFLGSLIALRIVATQQSHFHTNLSPAEVRMVVDGYFRTAIWHRVSGRGQLNLRPKLRRDAPTLSIDIEPSGTGSQVSVWTSAYTTAYGIAINHGTLMIRKRRGLAKRLQATAGALPSY